VVKHLRDKRKRGGKIRGSKINLEKSGETEVRRKLY